MQPVLYEGPAWAAGSSLNPLIALPWVTTLLFHYLSIARCQHLIICKQIIWFQSPFFRFDASGECCNDNRAYSYTVNQGCSNQPARWSLFGAPVCPFLLTHLAEDEHLPCCTWNEHFTAASLPEPTQYCQSKRRGKPRIPPKAG